MKTCYECDEKFNVCDECEKIITRKTVFCAVSVDEDGACNNNLHFCSSKCVVSAFACKTTSY